MTSAYDADVDVTIEAAFGFDPYATPTWTDITQYARGFTTKRGRSRILDQMQAGTATITLDNTDSRFDPNHSGSPYTGDLKVSTPIRIQAVHNSITYDLYRGFATGWPQTYPGKKDAVVVLPCIDAFRMFAQYEGTWTQSTAFSGTRIGAILTAVGWPAGWRDLDTGTHMVQALSQVFDSAMSQIHRTVLVEQGLFFIAGNGDATFRDANTRIQDQATTSVVFSDDGADLGYTDIRVDYDETQLWNSATVTRTGGEEQSTSDATSIGEFGERDLHLSETLHFADGEALALADWLVDEFKDVRARVPSLTVIPGQNPSGLWPQALGLELLDRVNVERTDVAGDDLDTDFHVEGVAHNVSMVGGRRWVTTFQLSPVLAHDDWWILGTSELGTDTRLGY